MANIDKELHQIKHAVYGREVRGAIHDAIEKAYNDATSYGGEKDLEIVLARGSYDALNKRLDANDKEINNLDEHKADKGALAQVAQSKRDKDVEIEMKDLSQEVKESMTGGSVAVVGEDAVGSVNLKDNAVTRDKLHDHFNVNLPWLESGEDLNYITKEGNYLVDNYTVVNSPHESGYSLLSVKVTSTTSNSSLLWIRQDITLVTRNRYPENHYRISSVDIKTSELRFISPWVKLVSDKVTQEDISGFLNKKIGTRYAEGVIDRDNPYKTGGFYNSRGEWINNDDFNTFKVFTEYGDRFWLNRDDLTIAAFDASGYTTKDRLSNKDHFIINDPYTKYITVPIRITNKDFVMVRGDFMPYLPLKLGQSVSYKKDYESVDWIALGTSITSHGKYARYVADALGLTLDNRGVSSGGITSHAGAGNTTMQAVLSIEDFKGLISIELGPNDWGGCPLGNLGDTDDDTWYGAVDKVCRTITHNTSARPFFITSTTTAFDKTWTTDEKHRRSPYYTNKHGFKYSDYVKAVKEVAQHYSIPVCDVYSESGLGGYHQNSATLRDHIHPSALGDMIIANHVIKFLENNFAIYPTSYSNPIAANMLNT